ncbi:MAG: xanthan lyase [Bacteroidales bacterium]
MRGIFNCGIVLLACSWLQLAASGQQPDRKSVRLERKAMRNAQFVPELFNDWRYLGRVSVDSIKVDRPSNRIYCYLSSSVTHIPVRPEWVKDINNKILSGLGRSFRNYQVQCLARGRKLEEYVPNAFRENKSLYDRNRMPVLTAGKPLVVNMEKPQFSSGLSGKHIALWPSHGLFFDQELDRWQWQRARLWQTVEDVLPWSFTSAFLVPMLENAGAVVLMPRERDTQVHEVIVDNNLAQGGSHLVIRNGVKNWVDSLPGFLPSDTIYPGQNPFQSGTSLSIATSPGDSAALIYVPDIPVSGDYAVYISYAKAPGNLSEVMYEVCYAGGKAHFRVNQAMGAGTWIYLGTFTFLQGVNFTSGSVSVAGGSGLGTITSDAVKFGGGMGNVARKPASGAEVSQSDPEYRYKLSGKPRWAEGSRYYLQFAGMPDSIVYSLNDGKSDYNDDYMSRGEWVNFLIGNSRPQYSDKYIGGMNIPVDLAFAFHTDAGVTANDSVIGTLGIYSTVRNNGIFPDGRSKLAGRDLADMIQTQVVEDIRQTCNPEWTRRGLWDREYSEAWRPVVPVMLLELLSHQNLADMRYGLDPRFRFLVSRSIYKGILKYLAAGEGISPVVQPLPPDHMSAGIAGERMIRLSWRPVVDRLEPTAIPAGYKVYMQEEVKGFDPGTYTADTFFLITLNNWKTIYNFRVTALNQGGESLPGETLSVSLVPEGNAPVLIVNAFDRICAPTFFDQGVMAGIAWWEDEGVAFGKEYGFSGTQYDFNRNSEWLHDDSQGWGASHSGMETQSVPGNTFNFPYIHGKALRDAGYSFVSVSDEVFGSPGFDLRPYRTADIIFGEERGTPALGNGQTNEFRVFTPEIIKAISRFTQQGGNVFVSGAHIGADMIENNDSTAMRFARDVLRFTWRTGHATQAGQVYATDRGRDRNIFPEEIGFNTQSHAPVYRVESPDAIEPCNGAFRICRYLSGNCSAGTAYEGSYRTVVLGFPFETITDEQQRNLLIKNIMLFFNP